MKKLDIISKNHLERAGDDTYIFSLNGGTDTIDENFTGGIGIPSTPIEIDTGFDTLIFEAGIQPEQLRLEQVASFCKHWITLNGY